MSDDFLKKPRFGAVRCPRQDAVINRARPGAFGSLAAKVLGRARGGPNTVLRGEPGGGAEEGCGGGARRSGGKGPRESSRRRSPPPARRDCEAIVAAGGSRKIRPPSTFLVRRLGAFNKGCRRSSTRSPEDFLEVMDANVTQSWLMCARPRAGRCSSRAAGGKVDPHLVGAAGLLGHPAGYTAYCALEVGGRRPSPRRWVCEWGRQPGSP